MTDTKHRAASLRQQSYLIKMPDSRSILLPASYLMMSLPIEGHRLSANQISSTYLNCRLRYNYFRFGKKTNIRHIEILLPISIATT